MAVVRADDWLVTLDLLLAAVLAARGRGVPAGGRITRGLVPQVLELAVGAVAAAAVGAGSLLRTPRPATSSSPRRPAGRVSGDASAGGHPSPGGWSSPCRSLPCSWPCSPPPMRSSARLTSDVLAWQPDVDLEDLLIRAVVVTVVAWGAAGLLGLAAGLLPAYAAARTVLRPEPVDAAAPALPPASPGATSRATPTVAVSSGPPLPPARVAPPAGGLRTDLRPRTRPLPGPRSRGLRTGPRCASGRSRRRRSWSSSTSSSPRSSSCSSPTCSAAPTRWR